MGDLVIDDLHVDQLDQATWAGSSRHLQYVAQAIERAQDGEVDYLGVWQDNRLVGLGCIDYAVTPGAGRLWMLVVHPDFRSLGVGTHLIHALEQRALSRGVTTCELLVEKQNIRAHELYLRLGYMEIEETTDSWEELSPNGEISIYTALCYLMRKQL